MNEQACGLLFAPDGSPLPAPGVLSGTKKASPGMGWLRGVCYVAVPVLPALVLLGKMLVKCVLYRS